MCNLSKQQGGLDVVATKFKIGLNAFQLKMFALFFMTLDHLAATIVYPFSFSTSEILRVLGRIAAPLFIFLLIEGLHHTKSKCKYISRLYIASVATQVSNTILESFVENLTASYFLGNIFPLLMYIALFVTCIESLVSAFKNKKYVNLFGIIVLMIIPFVITHIYVTLAAGRVYYPLIYIKMIAPPLNNLEYSFLFVLIGVIWYFANSKIFVCISLGVLSIFSYAIDYSVVNNISNLLPWHFNFFELFLGTQWCMVMAIPFVALYNGNKGKSYKYFFYIYYPLHQYILYLFAALLVRIS
jgi:hypothetical protein